MLNMLKAFWQLLLLGMEIRLAFDGVISMCETGDPFTQCAGFGV